MPKTESYKNIDLLKWFNFCLDFRVYAPIAILYFSAITGSYASGLSIFAIATIATSCFELPTGLFSDLIGRKKSVIFGQVGTVLSIIIYACADTFLMLSVAAIFQGLATAFFSGNNSALLFDSLKENKLEDKFAEHEGKNSAMFQIALATSALVAGFILWLGTAAESYKALFALSVIPQIVGLFLVLRLVEPKFHENKIPVNPYSHIKNAFIKFKQNPKLRLLSYSQMLERGLGEAMYSLVPVFTSTLLSSWLIPILMFVGNAATAIGQYSASKLIQKFGAIKLLFVKSFFHPIMGVIITSFPSFLSPVINSLSGFSVGLGWVAQSSLLQKEFSDKERATMGSLNSLGGSILFAVFAYGLGVMADNFGVAKALLVANILSFTSLIFYWKLFKHK